MIASNVQRGPRWLSFIASIFGASKGIASSCFAFSSSSFSSTNRNSACGSTNFLISQGHATRSTLMSFRVIHFILTSRSPGICEFNGKAILIKLWWVCRDQAGKALTGGVDHVQVTVRTIIPPQANVCGGGLSVRGIHLEQRGKREKAGKRVVGLKAAEDYGELSRCGQNVAIRVCNRAKPESVRLLDKTEGQPFVPAIRGANACFV